MKKVTVYTSPSASRVRAAKGRKWIGRAAIASLLFATAVLAQRQFSQDREPDFAPFIAGRSSALEAQVDALGVRLRTNGKERSVLHGQLTDRSGTRQARVTLQLPGEVELAGFKTTGGNLRFNDRKKAASLPSADASLIDTFIGDSAEALFMSERKGVAIRLLGTRFKTGPNDPDYSPTALYDIYEVETPSIEGGSVNVAKRYFFDSISGLLHFTRHDQGNVLIETRFSNWISVEDSAYPGRIERLEGGERVFEFVVNSVSAGPAERGGILD